MFAIHLLFGFDVVTRCQFNKNHNLTLEARVKILSCEANACICMEMEFGNKNAILPKNIRRWVEILGHFHDSFWHEGFFSAKLAETLQ